MANFGTLGVAVSGLNAAQLGLGVTGHNLANVNSKGYTRQQLIQSDFVYQTIGVNGPNKLQLGKGTHLVGVRQIRDKFLDIQYRGENSKLAFYETKYNAGNHIETLLAELEGEYSGQEVSENLWDSIQELSNNPGSLEARGNFINRSVAFVDKMNSVYNDLLQYQRDLNDQITDVVSEINSLTRLIGEMNDKISGNEVTGDDANDYRDIRNNALDRLTELTGCDIKDRSDGRVDIFIEGNPLISNGTTYNIGLRYTDPDYSFVEPVFTHKDEILPYDSKDTIPVFTLATPIGGDKDNDRSVLKSLLVTRGRKPENWMSAPQPPDPRDTTLYPKGSMDVQYQKDLIEYKKEVFNCEEAVIPSTMKKLDSVFHAVVTLINDTFAPKVKKDFDDPTNNDPMGIDGSQYLEVFIRNPDTMTRYDANGDYQEEVEGEYFTMYTLGNVSVNPEFLDADGYDKIPLSPALGGGGIGSGSNECDVSDNTLLVDLLNKYDQPIVEFISGRDVSGDLVYSKENQSIKNGYNSVVVDVAIEMNESINFIEQQEIIMNQLENNRISMSGVSMDEEMTSMMRYQHAYNASARVVNVVDSMIDRVVNNTGRVGL